MPATHADSVSIVVDGRHPLTIEDVVAVARGEANARLSDADDFLARIGRGADLVDRLIAEDGVVYGVSTGYGDSCTVAIPPALVHELPHHLYAYHGVGLGRFLDADETRAVLLARLVSLAQGSSGVSVALLRQLQALLQHDILPRIPAEGSVGASGDLTPLSYVAAVLCGEREVLHEGAVKPAGEALAAHGLQPLRLRPKEGLAIMNGTAVMTALACLAWQRADYLGRLATRITAFNVVASAGNAHHFDEALFAVKPHPGQQRVAARLRVIELTEPVVAALLVTARQGMALRRAHEGSAKLSDDAEAMFLDLEARIPLVEEDRALDRDLHGLLAAIRDEAWRLYVD